MNTTAWFKTRALTILGLALFLGFLSFMSVAYQEAEHYNQQTQVCAELQASGKQCAWDNELGPGDYYAIEVKQ